MDWKPYTKDFYPTKPIVLFQLRDKQDGRIKYDTATYNAEKLVTIGRYFHFDMLELYEIVQYLELDEPLNN